MATTLRARRFAFALALAVAARAAAADPPAGLESLLGAEAGALSGWCVVSARQNAFAVVVSSPPGGRYVYVQPGRAPQRLAEFRGTGELSCHTPREARALSRTIASSETLHGSIRPRWKGTVVCGFTSDTEATCWQESPTERRFVKVGGWST